MTSLRERLRHDALAGAWHDGPRRYLLLRPDGLMGTFRALDAPARAQALDALADSVRRHGGDSLRAYAATVAGDASMLIAATIDAAADLGWGRWQIELGTEAIALTVEGSPFVAGWLADGPAAPEAPAVCAPVRGMLGALAAIVLGGPAKVQEYECAAQGHAACRFVATVDNERP